MTTTKITPKELLTRLNNGEVKYRFLTNDIEGFCAWTHEPILRTEYQLDDFLGSDYMSLYEYLKENNLEVVDLGMYEIFELKPLVKITPSEILELMNAEIEQTNLELGHFEPKVRFVTCDTDGIFCFSTNVTFNKRSNIFESESLLDGMQFNTTGYEIVGLSLNQMFSDYSI